MKPNRLWVHYLISRLLPETRFFRLKACLLRWCGAKVGENVRISSSARFYGGGDLTIGDDVWIGSGDIIHSVSGVSITIGNCCDLGPEVMILTGSHKIDSKGKHIAGDGMAASVDVGDGCWLGARSMILPGVVLHRKTLVAGGAVVVKGTSMEQSLMAGVPAQFKRKIT